MNILINGIGGPTPRSVARTLKKSTIDYHIIGTDCDRLAVSLYQNEIFDNTFLIPKAGEPNYWEAIEEILEKNEIELAIVLPELEVIEWSKRLEEQVELPCRSLIPSYSLAKLLIDKAQMTKILEPKGLVPPSVSLNGNLNNTEEIKNVIGYPFWIRSTTGSSGLGSLLVNNQLELENWVRINSKVEEFLASEYLPGRNLACKMLYFEGKLIRAAIGERVNYIMSKVAPSGVTGNTSFGRLLNEPEVFKIGSKAMDILFGYAGAKKHGFFTVDLKEDKNGKPLVTEVNIRHVAFTGCFAEAGANFAEDTIRLLNNDPTFDREFKLYEFEPGTIFLRDVDSLPIVMNESDLLKN